MNKRTFLRHTFSPDLFTPGGWSLDIGCRDFNFASIITTYDQKVIGCDPDPSIRNWNANIIFENIAVVGNPFFTKVSYNMWSDGEANNIGFYKPQGAHTIVVPCHTIQSLMNKYKIEQFDLIKMDCEGSEYEILKNIKTPIAKQLSIEFHDFDAVKLNPYYPDNERFYSELMDSEFGQLYKAVQHEKTYMNGRTDLPEYMNYWDSLFVLKNL